MAKEAIVPCVKFIRYDSTDGFSMTAVYSDKDYDYKGSFSGAGLKTHADVTEEVFFSGGKFELEYNTFLDF